MKTSQMISTISYNTKDFLQVKLNELVQLGVIDFWCAIFHKKEKDESKDHTHLFMIPNHKLDTVDLNEYLTEPVSGQLPLGCTVYWKIVQKGHIYDWFLYVLHDTQYLKFKGLEREYHYTQDEFFSNSLVDVENMVFDSYHTSPMTYHNTIMSQLRDSDNIDDTCAKLTLNGYVPLGNACGFHHIKQLIKGL